MCESVRAEAAIQVRYSSAYSLHSAPRPPKNLFIIPTCSANHNSNNNNHIEILYSLSSQLSLSRLSIGNSISYAPAMCCCASAIVLYKLNYIVSELTVHCSAVWMICEVASLLCINANSKRSLKSFEHAAYSLGASEVL